VAARLITLPSWLLLDSLWQPSLREQIFLFCSEGACTARLPPAEARQELYELMELAYLSAGLLDATPQREGGLAAVVALLRSKDGTISAAGELATAFKAMVPALHHSQLGRLARATTSFFR
jgi:hypothetical protein